MIWIVPLLLVYKDSFGFKYPEKADMSIDKKTKPNLIKRDSPFHSIDFIYVAAP